MLNDLLYAERDIMDLDESGNYYAKHVHAMTAEGLHSKSAIAAELAYRDACIDKLREGLEEITHRFETKQALHKDDCFAYKVASRTLAAV